MNHPAYRYATKQLKAGTFLSVHTCLQDYEATEPIWYDREYALEQITKAYKEQS